MYVCNECSKKISHSLIYSIFKCLIMLGVSISLKNMLNSLDEIKDLIKSNNLSCENDNVLVCGKSIDNVNRPLRTDQFNILTTTPSPSTQSQNARLFNITSFRTLNTNRPMITYVIENPANSGRNMYLDRIVGGSKTTSPTTNNPDLYIFLFHGAPRGDEPFIVFNMNLGSRQLSSMKVTLNDTTIGGDLFYGTLVDNTGGFNFDFEGRVILPPGQSLGIHFTAADLESSSLSYGMAIIWYELDIES